MSGLRKAMIGGMLAAILCLTAAPGAASIQHGSGDWARMSYNASTTDGNLFMFITVTQWGTQYYDGVPPQNQGGLGDGSFCLHIISEELTGTVHGFGCAGEGFTVDTLESVSIDGTVELDLTDFEGTLLGTETATLDVSMDGVGLVFPGARAATNPGPGAEVEYEFLRDAVVTGTVSSPTVDAVDLGGTAAVLERKNCVGYAVEDSDAIQACRFN